MSNQTKTAEKPQTQTIAQDQPQQGKQQVAVLQPPRLPYHPVYEERYGINGMMWRALVDAVYPSAKTPEGIILAVSYCQSKGYDVMKKMVHVVPIWSTSLGREVEGIWEAVSALRATAFRTGEYAGCDETLFGPMKSSHFEGEVGRGQYAKQVSVDLEYPEWAQVVVYRLIQGQRCRFPGPKVYFLSAYGCQGKSDVPNDKWAEGPSYMLEKVAEAAALRKAFPEALGGVNAAEEMEGRKLVAAGPVIDHEPTPAPPRPTRESVKAEAERARKDEVALNRQFRETMREDTTNATQTSQGPQADEAGEQKVSAIENADPETGEVQEPERVTETAKKPEPHPVDYAAMASQLVEKMQRASSRKLLEAITTDYAQELDTLRTDAATHYDAVMGALKERRAWFQR